MSKKLTPWFRDVQRPGHVGVYQTVDAFSEKGYCYQFWNGFQWNVACKSAKMAAVYNHPGDRSCFQNDAWRGLAEKP